MRIKFLNYITKLNKNGERIEDKTKIYNPPVAHCINGIAYHPVYKEEEFIGFTEGIWP